MSESEECWYELTDRIDEFQNILRILNHYYEMLSTKVSPLFQFRKEVAGLASDQVQIFLSPLGKYEFQIACKVPKQNRCETWIHLDGIQEERDRLQANGIHEHPVFQIVCLNDLFQASTVPCTNPLLTQKKVANGD
ncbi:hypothetical protein LPTSP4_23810 [Leptospira ryugenii]|uniref:Uncharacterized protein n=1 Tax=Leptospira ryugenii TaxID=1917863 RepID=A0A2P2E1X3_9LEPT|nr:hypothetical protein [Leptospira ryugenii]GBF50854.1 hypothetical protein LPTSP4_23810 [Leptospira ryugenii]